jgi:hypothetical protein
VPRQAEGGEAACGGEPRVHGGTSAVGLENKTGQKWDRGKGLNRKGFLILRTLKQSNSNLDLNSST